MPERGELPEPRPRMTLRVYTITPDGTITHDRGTLHVIPGQYAPDLFTLTTAFPPCECARCVR